MTKQETKTTNHKKKSITPYVAIWEGDELVAESFARKLPGKEMEVLLRGLIKVKSEPNREP